VWTPIQFAASTVGQGLSAAAPVLGQATQILQENPLLGQAIGAATGMPVSSWLTGSAVPQAAMAEGATAPVYVTPDEPNKPTVPVWVWLAAGVAALGGVFLLTRKKS
jgi:hypothetical protein